MRKQIQTAELRIMMQKKNVTCKKQAGQGREICPACFFLTGGKDEKMHRKRAKKNEKICKKQLTFVRGFDIIILALSNRAKLIKSH